MAELVSYPQKFVRQNINRTPAALGQQGNQQGVDRSLAAQQIIQSGDAIQAAYQTEKVRAALAKFTEVKKLGPISTFGVEITNNEATAQTVVLFDSYGIASQFGFTQGTVSVTTTQGITYAKFIELLKDKEIFTDTVDYQVSESELQFKQPFKMVTTNVDGSQLPIPLGNMITMAENPTYFNPKLLKLDLNVYLDGTVFLVFNVRPGETVNLTFNVLYQNKRS